MKARKIVKIGYYIPTEHLSDSGDYLNKISIWPRILLTLAEYLVKYSKQFDDVTYKATTQPNTVLPNGTLGGGFRLVNRSEVDIMLPPVILNEANIDIFDYCYPYKLSSLTFVTSKPQYKPQIFGILQTFALPLWIAILLAIIAMIFAYYVILNRKYSLHKFFLHVFAVFVRQSAIISHSSIVEKLLLYSWVLGAMFLCLAFESAFLSFLAVPTVTKIKDVTQLTRAVENGEYHCIDIPGNEIRYTMLQSNLESLRILGEDMEKNLKNAEFMRAYYEKKINNFAFVEQDDFVEMYARVGFVLEDRLLEHMRAMPIRKGFCCKKKLDTFVHRFMASGLFSKYFRDSAFLVELPNLLKYPEEDNNKKPLSLTDVAPPFIFLLAGHFISIFVFVGEIMSNCWKKMNYSTIIKRSGKRKVQIEDAVSIEMH